MSILTIAQAASLLKISKKTLMRWDASGKFPALRDSNGFRVYDEADVLNHAQWFELRRKHKAHNRKLTAIREEADKFLATKALEPTENPKMHKFEDMKKAYDDLRNWEELHKKIIREYSKLPQGFKHKVDPES